MMRLSRLSARLQAVVLVLGLCSGAQAEVERLYYCPNTSDASCKGTYGYLFTKPNFTNAQGVAKAAHAQALCTFVPGLLDKTASASDSVTVYGMRYTGICKPNISQGTLILVAGGAGTTIENATGTLNWWCNLDVSGTGDVPFDLSAGVELAVGSAVRGTNGTLVKRGAGKLLLMNNASARDFTLAGIRHEAGDVAIVNPKIRTTPFTYTFAGEGATLTLDFTNLVFTALKLAETEAVTGHAHGFSSTAGMTLEIRGLASDQGDFHGAFKGNVSLLLDLPDAAGELALSGADSTTTGDVSVRAGTLRLKDGAVFSGGGNVFVDGADAVLAVDADAVFAVRKLCLAHGGKVSVPEGVSVAFQLGELDGAVLPAGTYASGNADWVSGAGTVRIGRVYRDEIALDVPSGAQTLEAALQAFNAARGETVTVDTLNGGKDKARPLVKRGAGQLDIAVGLADFVGAIHIEEGTLNCTAKNGMGRGDVNTPCWVYRGATYRCRATSNSFNPNRTFRIAGNGVDGRGALWLENGESGNWGMGGFIANPFYLEEDATVGGNAWVGFENVRLNGHTLVITGNAVNSPKMLNTIYGDGHVVVSNTSLRQINKFVGTNPGNTLTVLDGAEFRFWSNATTFEPAGCWTVKFGDSVCRGDVGFGTRGETFNTFGCPVVLDGALEHASQNNNSCGRAAYAGPVSGPGGLTATSDKDTFWLLLLNASNSFTGGITMDKGVLWPYGDGTVPADEGCGPVTLDGRTERDAARADYDGVAFVMPGACRLPELRVTGSQPRRVQGGEGSWKGIVKSGSGTLEYYSALGAPELDVTAGVVKLPRGAQPGLWEGAVQYPNASAATAAFNGADTPSNRVLRGIYTANPRERYHSTPTAANKLVTYRGYVWNRTDAAQTLTFASAVVGPVKIKIDGEEKLSGAGGSLVSAAVTLAPGPHAFEYRAINGAPCAPTGWPGDFGCAVASGDVGTSDTNLFSRAVDDGDGALFTRTADADGSLPAFGKVRLAAGAVLDVNGNRFEAAVLSGAGAVTNSAADAASAPALTLTDRLCVDGSELSPSAALAVHVPVTLGENLVVSFTNALAVRRGTFPLLRAEGGGTISLAGSAPLGRRLVAASSDAGEREAVESWVLRLSADSKTLSLAHEPGTVIILR